MKIMTSPRATAATLALSYLALGTMQHATMSLDVVVLALVIGLAYLLLAAAVALTHRMSLVVNLAVAMTGLFGYTVAQTALAIGAPWVVAVLAGVAAAAAVGALTELILVRRLLAVPRAVAIMATCALAIALIPVTQKIASQNTIQRQRTKAPISDVPLIPDFHIGVYLFTASSFLLLAVVGALTVAVTIVLRRTRVGLRALAAADDRSLAQFGGVAAGRYVLVAWAAAGAVATLIAILGPFPVSAPAPGTIQAKTVLGINAEAAGSVLRLVVWPAVIAAVGRSRDVPAMVLSAFSLGLIEVGLLWHTRPPVWLAAVTAVVLFASGLLTPPATVREERPAAWLAVHLDARWPEPWRGLPGVRRLRVLLALTGFVALCVVLATRSTDDARDATTSWLALVVLGLAVFVETGMAGALTFAPLPVAAVGAVLTVVVTQHTGAVGLGLAAAVLAGVLLGALVAVLDLRARGLTTFSATLVMALAASAAVEPFAGRDAGVPIIAGQPVGRGQIMLAVAVVALGAFVVVANLSRSAAGRAVVAVRDNRSAARAFGLRVDRVRVAAGSVSGALAGLGGVLLVQGSPTVQSDRFGTFIAVALISACLVGGLSAPSGAVVGTFFIFGLPLMFPRVSALLDTNFGVGIGALAIILVWPGGLLAMWRTGRDRGLRWLAERNSWDGSGGLVGLAAAPELVAPELVAPELVAPELVAPELVAPELVAPELFETESVGGESAGPAVPAVRVVPGGDAVLSVRGLSKAFGGVVAVDDVNIDVRAGEILTLVGPNGAGKTTVFDLVTGFLRPDSGQILLDGVDISVMPPGKRARAGLVRTFQNSALFPTLTAHETLSLALERDVPLPFLRGALALDPGARDRAGQAMELLDRFGLTGYADTRVGHLSTGTRRILDLAAAHALGARVLLLDEPAAGVAQREVEALAGVLEAFRRDYAVTLVVIEHDLALCSRIGDRMVVMATGGVIADGPPSSVLKRDVVLEAYIGAAPAVPRSTVR